MGKQTTLSNVIGLSNGRRSQSCIPKRPVACNFKTKSLYTKPPRNQDRDCRTKDRDLRTKDRDFRTILSNKSPPNTQSNEMVSVLDVSMVDVSSPQRNIPTPHASQADQSIPKSPKNTDPIVDFNSQTSANPATETNDKSRSALLEAHDISIIGKALQATVNDDSWATSDDGDGTFYQTAISTKSLAENHLESDTSSESESDEMVIFENTLDRRFDPDNIQEFSESDGEADDEEQDDATCENQEYQVDLSSNTVSGDIEDASMREVGVNQAIDDETEQFSPTSTVCLDEEIYSEQRDGEVDPSSNIVCEDVDDTSMREGDTNQNTISNGTEPYSPTTTVFSINKSSDSDEASKMEQSAADKPKPELNDFEIIFKTQIESQKITMSQIEAIKRIKIDKSAAYDAIIRFLELVNAGK